MLCIVYVLAEYYLYLGFHIQHEIVQRRDNSRSPEPGTPKVIVVISVSLVSGQINVN